MRYPTRLTFAASCVAAVLVVACSDSTGPTSAQTAALLAARFDSMYVTANARGQGGSTGYSNRASIVSFLEIPAAFGAVPSSATITTANGIESWKGFELEDVQTSGGVPSDTTYLLIAYRESDVHTVLLVFYGKDGSITDGGIITNDTLSISATGGTGSTSRTSLGGACATPASTLSNPQIATLVPLVCARATFNASAALTLPSRPNVDAALTSLRFSAQSFNGERFVEPIAGAATARRVRALLQHLHGRNRP